MQLSLSLMCHVCTLQLVIVSHLQLLSVTAANGLKISSDRSDIFKLELHIVMTALQILQIETAADAADAADGDDKHLPPDMIECAPSTWPSPAQPLITAFVCQLFSSPVSELARTATMNRDEARIEARSQVLL